ncbi:hypothetical protein M422DRAFT_246882 [Sphaerobolus stellatus SS14]|nr:hypothetical protein M422DRAFT_246882 [Sphaerobolus stellatus SS14]
MGALPPKLLHQTIKSTPNTGAKLASSSHRSTIEFGSGGAYPSSRLKYSCKSSPLPLFSSSLRRSHPLPPLIPAGAHPSLKTASSGYYYLSGGLLMPTPNICPRVTTESYALLSGHRNGRRH